MTIAYHASDSNWAHLQEMLTIALTSWIPKKPGMLVRSCLYRTLFAHMGKAVQIERGCDFYGSRRIEMSDNVFISYNVCLEASQPTNRIVLGHGVLLKDNVRLSSEGPENTIVLDNYVQVDRGVDMRAHEHGCITIGQGTYIGPYACIAGPGHIQIGENCMIASHSGIYANNHNFADLTRPICVQGTTNEGIVIEDDCWLGTGVKVLDGVTIGHGSVIGAGAVVTKNIPPYSIAVGVPAKVIARRDRPKSPQSTSEKSIASDRD